MSKHIKNLPIRDLFPFLGRWGDLNGRMVHRPRVLVDRRRPNERPQNDAHEGANHAYR
jgi:hypothetical protein